MSDDWYVRIAHKTLGPLTEDQLRKVFEAHRIGPETPVRKGIDGPWTPADRALPVAAREKAVAPSKSKSRIPIVAVVGLAVLVAGLWVAFEFGRRRARPATAAARPDDEIKPSAVASPEPPIETPVIPGTDVPIPDKPRPSLLAKRPLPSMANNAVATVTGDRASLTAPHVEAAKRVVPPGGPHPQPKPAEGAQQPKAAVAKVAPVVVPKAPATQTDLLALETMALHSSTAKDALALYPLFRATRTMSPAVEGVFHANRQVWEDRAQQDLVRLGDRWVAAVDAAKARDEAAQLFQQAYELTKNLSFDEAQKTLERASRVDLNSIAADFTLGLLNSITPPKVRNPKTAAKQFHVVLERLPGYVPALNNLALVEIRLDKYADAVRHLREAADRSPTSDEVTQNLARFVSEAQLERIHPSQSVLSEASKLYSQLVMKKGGTPAEVKQGWRYLPLVLPKEQREGLARLQAPEADSTTCVAPGTGFVVEPHYVLTCRHVVDDLRLGRADKIELIDPTDPTHQRRLPATCVDVAQEDDLCLLRCDQLNAPRLSLADKVPPRGSDVLLIGFPGGSEFGFGMKTTRGVVEAIPGDLPHIGSPKWCDFSRKLWYDAASSSHAASGGAVCDDRGNVVAIHSTAYRVGDDPSNAKYAGGVPAPNAAAFLHHSLPTSTHPPLGGPSLKWSDVDAKVSPSLVLVVVGYRKVALVMSGNADTSPLTRAIRQATADIYDDRFCTVCNGRARIRCRAPGCPYAAAHDESAANDLMNGGPAQKPASATNSTTTSPRRICPECLGTGYVRCPHCSIGIDPQLR
jgi:S1-C subfamily serine protease